MKNKLDSIQKLSFLIPLLVIIVTLTGILNQSIYSSRLNSITTSELLGQDFVTLIVGIIFFICLLFERHNFYLKVVNLGMLSYFMYVYSYFCFSIISSIFFFLYIVIFSLSLFIFIFRLSALLKEKSLTGKNSNYPTKTISIFFFVAVLIMIVKEIPWLIDITLIKNKSIAPFDVYLILDLAFVFPAMIIIAVMNLLNKPSCVVFSGIVIIKMITLMPALLFNDIFYFIQNGYFKDFSFVIITSVFTLFSLILLYYYKRGISV